MTNSIAEIGTDADLILIIGSNTAECHPLIARQVIKAQERGARLLVLDPRRTEMANKADLWLRLPAGYNIPVINAFLHLIINEQLYDASFVEHHTEGFEELKRAVADYPPEQVALQTGLPVNDLISGARLYAQAGAASILYCMGVTQFSCGTGSVVSLSNLAAITGNLGRPGTGVNPLRGQNNVQGACDMGALPNMFPGYLKVTVPANRSRYEDAWETRLPDRVGLKIPEIPAAITNGELHALYVFGENPVMSDPDCDHFRQAIEELDFLVVEDIFLTETARLADLVLPAAAWGEKEGTFTNTERRVQRVRQAINPPGEAKPDWWIFTALAERIGYRFGYQRAEQIWNEVRDLVPEKFGGISYERLDQSRGIHWPCPHVDHPGTPFLYNSGCFTTSSQKAKLRPVLFDPVAVPSEKAAAFTDPISCHLGENPDRTFPFLLTTGRRAYHYHTGTMTRKSSLLNKIGSHQQIEINPDDARRLGIADNDYIKLTSRRGAIAARAWVTGRVPEGTLFTTFHFWEANANELTAGATDPISGIPEYKRTAVQAEKITAQEAKRLLAEKKKKYRVDQPDAKKGVVQ